MRGLDYICAVAGADLAKRTRLDHEAAVCFVDYGAAPVPGRG